MSASVERIATTDKVGSFGFGLQNGGNRLVNPEPENKADIKIDNPKTEGLVFFHC
jgi:hypothetical protein